MEQYITECGLKELDTVEVNKFGMMVQFMKDIGLIIKLTEKVD